MSNATPGTPLSDLEIQQVSGGYQTSSDAQAACEGLAMYDGSNWDFSTPEWRFVVGDSGGSHGYWVNNGKLGGYC